ncbi:hypothetical protein [Maricaulis sp.]|uniref:hypothetical protein n=1 Tax=Maricaulis sp. TaxID=1486257 RepID=UPI0026253D6D|nr:hypothetical protein [Maricaulis sp.]
MTTTRVLLDDDLSIATRFISPTLSVFNARDGVFTPVERLKAEGVTHFAYACRDERYGDLVRSAAGFEHEDAGEADQGLSSTGLEAGRIIDTLDQRIGSDVELMGRTGQLDGFVSDAPAIIGADSAFKRHPSAVIEPGCIINTENGPVVIDANARIARMSYIAGPAYIGPDARIDSAHLSSTVIGRHGRLGGEVEASIFNDFSNKHHEGFVGHSLIGQWVNLGALTTTSDLKNNYGEVRLTAPAHGAAHDVPVAYDTGTIKFGSVISEFVKTGIGTLLSTGSVIDLGANLFEAPEGKYVPAFVWGSARAPRYRLDRFLGDAETIAARRKQTLSAARLAVLRHLYTQATA